MGYIKSGMFVSLDGVIESPETWHFPYFNDEMGAVVGDLMAGNDALLLGRQTYDEFAAYWPNADPTDPMTAAMNGTRKYVVSRTLADADWENSSVVSGDVAAELAVLKKDTRLGTTGGDALAFKNPDGSYVAVVYNSGAAKKSIVALGGKKVELDLPQNGFATVNLK